MVVKAAGREHCITCGEAEPDSGKLSGALFHSFAVSNAYGSNERYNGDLHYGDWDLYDVDSTLEGVVADPACEDRASFTTVQESRRTVGLHLLNGVLDLLSELAEEFLAVAASFTLASSSGAAVLTFQNEQPQEDSSEMEQPLQAQESKLCSYPQDANGRCANIRRSPDQSKSLILELEKGSAKCNAEHVKALDFLAHRHRGDLSDHVIAFRQEAVAIDEACLEQKEKVRRVNKTVEHEQQKKF